MTNFASPATAAAQAFLRLSAAEDANVLSTAVQRQALAAMVKDAVDAVSEAWGEAGETASDFWGLVKGNNPTKEVEEILSRPDVKDAFARPFRSAGDLTKDLLTDSWQKAGSMGANHAASQLGALGIEVDPPALASSSKFLNELREDITKNTRSSASRLSSAAKDGDAALEKVSRDLRRRNLLSLQVGSRRAYHEAALRTYRAAAKAHDIVIAKQWVTIFSPGTCAMCAALHGSVVPLNANFDAKATLSGKKTAKVYKDLKAPPRHPNCRCSMVPVILRPDAPSAPRTKAPELSPLEGPRASRPLVSLRPGPEFDADGPKVPAEMAVDPVTSTIQSQLKFLQNYFQTIGMDIEATKAIGVGFFIPSREFAKFSPKGVRFGKTIAGYALPSYFDTIQRMLTFAALWWAATQLGEDPPTFEDIVAAEQPKQESDRG